MRKKKVLVAMSGGVDSSVAAAILKNRGYDVVGIFMKFWTPRLASLARGNLQYENKCCSAEAQIDVRRVAAEIGIPVYFLDVRKEFKKRVVNYFIQEYKKGNTPNPCVMCNKYIKFKFLIDKMFELKADFVATGHYARVKNGKLSIAKDKIKDQSYFLWQLTQNQLKHVLFPVGDYTKTQIRTMAKKFNLPVFEKKDSQEICFVNNLGDFLKKYIKTKPGPIITTEGKKIGEHKGLIFYTIGQRKGITIDSGLAGRSLSVGWPFYVVDKDFKKNALIVAQGDFNQALYKKEMMVKNVNWANKPKKFPIRCNVKIRYGHRAVPCSVFKIQNSKLNQNSKLKIVFSAPQRAITPGQSAVFYGGNEALGGGIIEQQN